jgi:hypothetical protein
MLLRLWWMKLAVNRCTADATGNFCFGGLFIAAIYLGTGRGAMEHLDPNLDY